MSAVEQMENIAKASWEAHPASQPVGLGDRIAVCVKAEELLGVLISNPRPKRQIVDEIHLDRNNAPGSDPRRVSVEFFGETANRFVNGGAVNYVSFETHPEWTKEEGAEDKRWLLVRGVYPDDNNGFKEKGKMWGLEYVFENYGIKKHEKIRDHGDWKTINEDAELQQSDLAIIESSLSAIQNEVVPLLVGQK